MIRKDKKVKEEHLEGYKKRVKMTTVWADDLSRRNLQSIFDEALGKIMKFLEGTEEP